MYLCVKNVFLNIFGLVSVFLALVDDSVYLEEFPLRYVEQRLICFGIVVNLVCSNME